VGGELHSPKYVHPSHGIHRQHTVAAGDQFRYPRPTSLGFLFSLFVRRDTRQI
jgi:hypothetical protein